ncbi:SIR2 family protein [Undibacterium sp.]|uniref:SIR2 family protein n=1 Tax=Undibacterium sp. TaxID=1914977 RepID=UPI0025D64644|nr:SIR2 family protein [Undibacterium sp.]
MQNTVFFGNGLNRISKTSVSWEYLLNSLKGDKIFPNKDLPNTMVYERIFMEKLIGNESQKSNELLIKNGIADAMKSQDSNELFELLANMDFENYLTTNYDYAFEKAIKKVTDCDPEKLSTEDIYSLRRKRAYGETKKAKYLWNIHGEIEHPKSIMLGLDHYCGSVSKIDSYVKGTYKYLANTHLKVVPSMIEKLKKKEFCYTAWVDLFFSSNIHIIGFTLDYSETDIWWLLNKRARFATNGLVKNKIFFYADALDEAKHQLLTAFGVEVVIIPTENKNYKKMYETAINKMLPAK